jgi:predicted NBD/HSP70 family sugar kinase
MPMIRLGVDLGGTKIEVVALDDGHRELLRRRVPTPAGDYMGTVMAICALVEAAEAELRERCSVGVGIPGAESVETGLIKNANSTCLNGRPLRRDLQAVLQREVRIANDANCFALSEATDGAGAGASVVFGVILGTGVGGGIVIDGRVLSGPNRIAGEWGHNPYPRPDPDPRPCYCGRKDCVETYLSGPAIEAEHRRLGSAALSLREIASAAEAGHAACKATIDRYAGRLAIALSVVINVLDPDVIVLGGGVSQVGALYDLLPVRLADTVFSDSVRTRVLPPTHGDSSGVRGAAWLWKG